MDKTTGTIVTPSGEVAILPTTLLTEAEASLLRAYKKFLRTHGLKEALYCNSCWERNLSNGCEAFVTDDRIVIRCRCRMRAYTGSTLTTL